jgi:coenzyme PQQ precursor peptide PqqA
MNVPIQDGNIPNQLEHKENIIMWSTPIVKEIAVGLEINCYMCAEI